MVGFHGEIFAIARPTGVEHDDRGGAAAGFPMSSGADLYYDVTEVAGGITLPLKAEVEMGARAAHQETGRVNRSEVSIGGGDSFGRTRTTAGSAGKD